MKADLTRDTFHPFQRFTRVLMQQGRVQLDADWNEQAAILLHYLQALAADLIGPHGGPAANLGFRISDSTVANNFAISSGHYYVDGILCELGALSAPVAIKSDSPNTFQILSSVDSFKKGPVLLVAEDKSVLTTITILNGDQATVDTDPNVKDVLGASHPKAKAYPNCNTFLTQADYPLPSNSVLTPGNYQIYLDVWERLITYVEDDSIREVALGGAETAARSKLVCQVKQCPVMNNADLRSRFQPDNRGRLKAQAKQTSISTDPCVIAPDASYSGPENQLYRVEIHTGGLFEGNPPATFKCSRENGSVVFPIVSFPPSGGAGAQVVLENLGRDDRFGLAEQNWVEVLDDNYVLLNNPGALLLVQAIDTGSLTVTLDGTFPSNLDQTKHPLLRRWDQTFGGDTAQGGLQKGSDSAALIVEGSNDTNWLSIEDGIQIQFQPAEKGSPNQYRTGDYWLIPARTATGDVEWPTGANGPLPRPPDGVDHHYAPLAVIDVSGNVEVTVLHQFVFGPPAAAP